MILRLRGNKILIKAENPLQILAEVLGDISFDRGLRRIAEEALKSLSEER